MNEDNPPMVLPNGYAYGKKVHFTKSSCFVRMRVYVCFDCVWGIV